MKTFKQFLTEGIVEAKYLHEIKETLRSLKSKIVDRRLSTEEVIDLLNDELYPFGIRFEESPNYNEEDEGWDESGQRKVGLDGASYSIDSGIIAVNYMQWIGDVLDDAYNFSEFIDRVVPIIGHELIHREQMFRAHKVNQPKNPREDLQGYLAHENEIMAWAFQAVQELLADGWHPNLILKSLKTHSRGDTRHLIHSSYAFSMYYDNFDTEDKVFKKFLTYMYKFLIPQDE